MPIALRIRRNFVDLLVCIDATRLSIFLDLKPGRALSMGRYSSLVSLYRSAKVAMIHSSTSNSIILSPSHSISIQSRDTK